MEEGQWFNSFMKYSDILLSNNKLGQNFTQYDCKINILSNITVNKIVEILSYELRSNSLNPEIKIWNYDNILQDSGNISSDDIVIVFWEFSNIFDGINYKLEFFTEDELIDLEKKIKNEIDFLFTNLKDSKLVLFNMFSVNSISNYIIKPSNADNLCDDLNDHIASNISKNTHMIFLEKNIHF